MRRWAGLPAALPLFLFVLLCFDLPVAGMLLRSIGSDPVSLDAYRELFGTDAYVQVIWITIRIALVTTAACLLLGYPLAYWIHTRRRAGRVAALALVLLPFWVSVLVRAYAWIVLLGNAGVVNRSLRALGLVQSPLPIIYNEFGVVLGTVNVLLPYLVLPLYAAMAQSDPELVLAASSLGATPRQAFWRVFFMGTRAACLSGALLVFVLTFGFYVTPALLGGGRVVMVANLLDLLINQIPSWELAAAIATLLLALVLVLLALMAPLRQRAG